MSVSNPNKATRLAIFAALSLSLPTVQAEMGIGYRASEWDPATKEFKEVYKDWQEGVVFNTDTGDYIVTYRSSSGTYYETTLEPATKIDPTLKSKFKSIENSNAIRYEYRLKNSTKAKQNVEMLLTHVSNINPGGLVAPSNWDGRAFPTFTDSNLRLSWTHEGVGPAGGLLPGKTADGFMVESNDLPGVVVMEIKGNARHTTWLAHQPNIETPVGKQVLELEAKDFIPRLAAAPKIGNPTPFSPVVVLGGIQKHVKTDMASMQLIDPALAALVDRGLTQAIAAAQGGNTPSLLHEIKNLRQLLKQEHVDVDQDNDSDDDDKEQKPKPRIAKLAAKVLDFDLKYVEKRIKGNKD